ncbi:TVP38/TMEM64 family protein (plasmid) [Rhodococcus pseudokoreensis]|uniref:TVP38/TMEM64 family membrane protein n=1 Tax=Rhodococcus pseudokoreensis TaxID=2811421 RepID=A0A974VY67_9NOCA|nr:TVP38/TMEM64 family protein [Rhodococcus pseudokoreensis]
MPGSGRPRTRDEDTTAADDSAAGAISRPARPNARTHETSRWPVHLTSWPGAKNLLDRRVLAAAAVLTSLGVAAVLLPRPSISQMRDWAESVGPAFVLVFFLTQALLTIAPVPRTVFTLSAGLLFGPVTGITFTIAATTIAAVLALLLVRALGRTAVEARLSHPAVQAIDARLARRGWLAVGSLRLIAPAPFALVNYCCALSSVRVVPYTVATVVGILPGTVGVVLLGDALTGQTNPALMVVTTICIAMGVAGLLVDTRFPVSPASDAP